ncbi:MAG: AIPR family protein [Candidatus Symbiothrix sp.]|jgi:hypothetical protein|nr:AIPR family protein [Candidatus Symbiothrix sp.]
MVENKFINGILQEFKSDFKLSDLAETKVFEYLVNYVIVSKLHPEAFGDTTSIKELDVDNGSNFGIDGIALIVNNNLVLAKEELEILRKSKNLDVKIIFTQSKTSSNYDSGDLYKFIGAVKNFFSKQPSIPLSDEIKYFKDIYDELFEHENSRYLSKQSPSIYLYYATTGKDSTSDTIAGIVKQEEKTLQDVVPELKEVKIYPIGADFIIDAYNEIENRFDVVINFKNNLSLDKIEHVEQSYIGYLSVPEFMKLISDNEQNLRRNLFYENVRDFQGFDNAVNSEMGETINSKELQDKFILLNNGITIVAKHFKNLGSNDYEMREFQIVNGCQTSNMIFQCRNAILSSPNFLIPVKIIHTNDNDVITRIIRATNRQTPVPEEAFITLEKFHKRLQEFYSHISVELPEKLYYERRSKEYANSEQRIEKARIVNLHSQIRAFTAVFLSAPHLVYNNNPTEILRRREFQIFQEDHTFYPYFLSNYLLFNFQKLIDIGKLNSDYALFRYYAIMIYRILASKSMKIPWLNSRDAERYCSNIVASLDDENKKIGLFNRSIDIIKKAIKEERAIKNGPVRNIIRTLQFKDRIFEVLKSTKF